MTILAHDLRNYLTPAYMYLSALYQRAQHEQRESDMQAAARSKQALDHALSLTNNLLDITRVERGLLELSLNPLDLGLFIRQVAALFESGDSPIAVSAPEGMIVLADNERIRQVFHNLLGNALTHSPRGAPITITLTRKHYEHGPRAVLSIHNLGPTIPPQLLSRIFQRFSAGRGSRGLGLGLYLAHGIITAHGGTLTVESTATTGTCFTLSLPLANPNGEPPAERV